MIGQRPPTVGPSLLSMPPLTELFLDLFLKNNAQYRNKDTKNARIVNCDKGFMVLDGLHEMDNEFSQFTIQHFQWNCL